MACISAQFIGFDCSNVAIGGVRELYIALWGSDFADSLIYEGNYVTGETKLLGWKQLIVDPTTTTHNTEKITDGEFIDTLSYQVAGRYTVDRDIKNWLLYNKLVFIIVGENDEAWISGEERGNEDVSFSDNTNTESEGNSAVFSFQAKTTYVNYGISNEYLNKVKDTADCGEYTDRFALGNETTIQEQFDCEVQEYTGFIP